MSYMGEREREGFRELLRRAATRIPGDCIPTGARRRARA